MAITKASLIDLNGQELILDADADTSITADTDDILDFKTGGTDRLKISGNNLHLNGGTDARIQLGSGGAGANSTSNDTVHIRGDGDDMKLMTAADGNYIFENNGSEKMRLSSIGQLKISTDYNNEVAHRIQNVNTGNAAESNLYLTNADNNAAGLALGVAGTGASGGGGYVQDGCYVVAGSLASGGLSLMTRSNSDIRFYTNGHTNERIRITSDGYTVTGGTSHVANATVSAYSVGTSNGFGAKVGNAGWFNFVGNNTSDISTFYVKSNGDYHFAGSDVSDKDLKENITDVPDGSLALVKQLKPRTFNFKASEGFEDSSRTGFIAQEVASVMTTNHSVATGTDGQKDMGVNPMGLIAHLTKAIQELEARLKTLEDA